MLLQCQYSDENNTVDKLHIEHLTNDNWETFDLNTYTPGFDVFMYAILSCQHMYFRNNATEYGLKMQSSEGLITVITDKHRSIDALNVEFKGELISGTATEEIVNSINARMKLCPVSINLKDIKENKVSVSFYSA